MGVDKTLPDAAAFEAGVRHIWKTAEACGCELVNIQAGMLHRTLGGYPGRSHRMPVCCEVMRRLMTGRDRIRSEPAKGKGASLMITYALPR